MAEPLLHLSVNLETQDVLRLSRPFHYPVFYQDTGYYPGFQILQDIILVFEILQDNILVSEFDRE